MPLIGFRPVGLRRFEFCQTDLRLIGFRLTAFRLTRAHCSTVRCSAAHCSTAHCPTARRPTAHRPRPRRRALLTIPLLASALLLAAAPQASAHAELAASDPAGDAVLTSEPAQITLTFTEEVDLRLSAVKVVGPDGRRLDSGALRPGPTGADSLVAVLTPDQTRGTFSILWQVTASDDGHATSGHLTFAVGAPSTPAAVLGLGRDHVTSALSDAAQWSAFVGLALVSGLLVLRPRRAPSDEAHLRPLGGASAGEAPPRPSAALLIRQDAGLVAVGQESFPPGTPADALSTSGGQGVALARTPRPITAFLEVLDALPSRAAIAAGSPTPPTCRPTRTPPPPTRPAPSRSGPPPWAGSCSSPPPCSRS
ncbi:copper resistance protein CopC [Catenulispora yoronensis]